MIDMCMRMCVKDWGRDMCTLNIDLSTNWPEKNTK